MLPALAVLGQMLISKGLPIVANAIFATGKEIVEEKLGVKIEPDMTPEQLATLRTRAMEHEEFLINAAMQKQTLDLEDFKAEVEDKKSARIRDSEFLKAGKDNWRAHLMVLIAYLLVFYLAYAVLTSDNLNEFAKGVITLLLGRSLGWLDNIYNFEFGTTRGSRQKDETIHKLSGGSE